jgi:hypothetical protein
VELKGFSATNLVENVTLNDVVINGQPLKAADVKSNEFVRGVEVRP